MGRLIIRADTEREGEGKLTYKLYVESDDVTANEAEAIFNACTKSLTRTEEQRKSVLESARNMGMSEDHARVILNKLNHILKSNEEDE